MIEPIYQRFLQMTGDPGAAATLVLAEVLSSKEPEWLDVKQAAARLGISPNKMYQLCSEGGVRHKKVGRQIRITPDDLANVAEVKQVQPKNPDEKLKQFFSR
jgi:excisionase family DNA binding protein